MPTDQDPVAMQFDTDPIVMRFREAEVMQLAQVIAARLPTEVMSKRLLDSASFQRAVAGGLIRALSDTEIADRVADALWERIKGRVLEHIEGAE